MCHRALGAVVHPSRIYRLVADIVPAVAAKMSEHKTDITVRRHGAKQPDC